MKGVSPVVATVLMVAVAIAAAVVAYSWFMSMQASVQAEASRGAGTVGKEQLTIASVYCDDAQNGDGNFHVILRNLGDEQVKGKFTIYVKDAFTGEVNKTFVCTSTITVPAKNQVEINYSTCGLSATDMDCGNFPNIIVVEVHAPGGAVVSKEQRIR